MNITYIDNKDIKIFKRKIPVSIREDKKFFFKTKKIDNLLKLYEINKNNFILNGEFIEFEGLFHRRKSCLKKYLKDIKNFFILDLDDVKNPEKIFEILKKEDLNFILYYSISGNLKGAFLTKFKDYNYPYIYIKKILENENITVDPTAKNFVGIQAPVENSNVFFHQGKNIPIFLNENENENNKKIFISSFNDYEKNEFLNLALNVLYSKGFQICKEYENYFTLQNNIEKTKCGYYILKERPFIVYHFNKEKSFSIFNDLKEFPEFKNIYKKKFENEIFNLIYQDYESIKFNSRYVSKSKLFNDFKIKENECVILKSPMGTGKSRLIKKLKGRKLIITNRKSLANEFKREFPDFSLYSDFDYEPGKSLICQYESLYRFDIKNFDVIIIDEFLSIIEHSLSNLTENYQLNNLKFFLILKKLKTPLLIMDAFLTGFEKKFINRKKIHYFENLYRDDIDVFKVKHFEKFLEIINEKLKNNKITISVTNKKIGKLIKYYLQKNNSNKKIIFISGENKDYFKNNEIFEGKIWDALIYTPTITVGVNIKSDSKIHFHYTDGTIPLISSIQQIKRNRNAEKIYYFLKEKNKIKLIDEESLKDEYFFYFKKYNKIEYLDIDEFGNLKNFNEFGEFFILKIYLSNLLNFNQEIIFEEFLKFQFKNDIKKINEKGTLNLKKLKKDFENDLKNKFNQEIDLLLSLDEINLKLNLKKINELNFILENLFKISKEDIKELLNELKKNKKFLEKLYLLNLYLEKKEKIIEILEFNLEKKLNLKFIKNLEILIENEIKLKNIMKGIKDEKIKKLLKILGYKKITDETYKLDDKILYFYNKIFKKDKK